MRVGMKRFAIYLLGAVIYGVVTARAVSSGTSIPNWVMILAVIFVVFIAEQVVSTTEDSES